MACFDNWRVQAAALNLLDNDLDKLITRKEGEYKEGDSDKQTAIFVEYHQFVNRHNQDLFANKKRPTQTKYLLPPDILAKFDELARRK